MKLLVFSATWCQPCKELKKVLIENEDELENYVDVDIIDIDNNTELVSQYKVRGVPTTILVDKDETIELNRKTGYMNKNQLMEFIDVD